jgi:hypothetical protein
MTVKKIQLGGQYSDRYMIIDDDIAEKMSQYKWFGHCMKARSVGYASRWISVGNGKGYFIMAHRYAAWLYGLLTSWDIQIDYHEIDHINHNSLDNRRDNLRAVTHQINMANLKREKASSYRGVSWNSHDRRWRASIEIGGHKYHLGSHKTDILAAMAWDEKAKELNFPVSLLNFPHFTLARLEGKE